MANKVCGCGCGKPVRNRFAHGHNTRVDNPMKWTSEQREAQAQRMRDNNPLRDPVVRRKALAALARMPKQERLGPDHPMWAGERVVRKGYVHAWQPDHPLAERGVYRGRVKEHLLVAERALGRPIDPAVEIVHHINFNGTDNRPQNLFICSRSYHTWLHHKIRREGLEEHFRALVA